MSMKATAMPSPGLIFFTMARARTSPPGTSKSNFTSVPTGAGSGVEINNPPSPSVTTRDIPRPSTHCHATNMPFGRATRTYLRFASLAVGLMTTLFDYGGRTPVRTFTFGERALRNTCTIGHRGGPHGAFACIDIAFWQVADRTRASRFLAWHRLN